MRPAITPAPAPAVQESALSVGTETSRGDFDCASFILDRADDFDVFADVVHSVLELLWALARRLRTGEGLMALHVVLAEVARSDPDSDRRLGARLLSAHAEITAPVPDSITAAETWSHFYNHCAQDWNDALTAAGDRCGEVFIAALKLWRELVPESDSAPARWLLHMAARDIWPGSATTIRDEPEEEK